MPREKKGEEFRMPAELLEKWLKDEALTHAEAATALRCSTSAIAGWLRKNDMPGIASVALEGVKRRQRAANTSPVFICRVPENKSEMFQKMCDALGIKVITLEELR